jgi:transposase
MTRYSRQKIENLSEHEIRKQILGLYYNKQKTIKKIARILDISTSTIYRWINRNSGCRSLQDKARSGRLKNSQNSMKKF